ncbi:MAG: hypothetical protein WCZ15_02890, partial [Patescibacteria group bacterium]
FVKLDEEIHGLAHISQLNLGPKEKISELFTADEEKEFEIVSISPSEHRLGLKLANGKKTSKAKKDKEEKEEKEEKEVLEDEPKKEEKEKKKKTTNKEKVEK